MKGITDLSQTEKMIRGLKKGDANSFEHIYNLYSKKVFNFSKKFLKKDEDAQEIVQDVFVKLWNVRKTIDLNQSFNGLVFRIAKNMSLNHLRRKVGEPESFSALNENASSFNFTEQDVLFAEMNDLLEAAVEGLPPKRQEVFKMSRYECMSNKEISERLDISINTVEGQMRKAIKYLRTYVEWASIPVFIPFILEVFY